MRTMSTPDSLHRTPCAARAAKEPERRQGPSTPARLWKRAQRDAFVRPALLLQLDHARETGREPVIRIVDGEAVVVQPVDGDRAGRALSVEPGKGRAECDAL